MYQQHMRSSAVHPQSQIVCGGCRTVLMYPQGAPNVRCARCHHVTAVATVTAPQVHDMPKVCCSNPNCRVLLMYPRGAAQVQCSLCGTITSAQQTNQVAHVVCGNCRLQLMYTYGAPSVRCANCQFVTSVAPPPGLNSQSSTGYLGPPAGTPSGPTSNGTSPATAGSGSNNYAASPALTPQRQPIPIQTVVVENPPTLDESGQEVQQIVVGVTTKQTS